GLVAICIRGAMVIPSCTFSRQVALSIGGFREELWQSEDYDFFIRLAATGLRWRAIDEPLVIQRVRPDSRSTNREEVYLSALQAVESLATELPAPYRDALADAAGRFAGILFQLGAFAAAKRG